jgi:hypothetical protein
LASFFPDGKEAPNRRDIIEVMQIKKKGKHKAFLETDDIWEDHPDQESMANLTDWAYETLRDMKLMEE